MNRKSIIEEKVKNADCNVCKHVFFLPDDASESQKCRIIKMSPKPEIDMDLLSYIINTSNKTINFCEYFKKDEKAKKHKGKNTDF